MLTGVHFLLTYKCTSECDHCFLHCGPQREGTFTIEQLRRVFLDINKIRTVKEIYFEGGEPFLFYIVLLKGLRMATAAGLRAGIVTNAYWATSFEDAVRWLEPMKEIGVYDFNVSDDDFHRTRPDDDRADIAYRAAKAIGIPARKICIKAPGSPQQASEALKGKPVAGGGVLFKGRAAERLTEGLPVRPVRELTSCPYEALASPERVHVDAYGNVHVCQGLSMGNMWKQPLSELVREYDGAKHPIIGPLLKRGPAQLVKHFGLKTSDAYVDECHLCYVARKALMPRFPQYLAPREAYGL